MRDQVARHLERARLAARLTVVGSITDVAPVVTALARTMEKIHHDRGVAIEVHADEQRALPRRAARSGRDDRQSGGQCLQVGSRRGWRSRWCASGPIRRAPTQVLRIVVDDDGRGLSPSEREQVAQRGRRLDETKPGSGLGLSIVVELAAPLWRRTQARHRAARRPARRTGAAGGIRSISRRFSVLRAGLSPESSRLDGLIASPLMAGCFHRIDFRGSTCPRPNSPPSPSSVSRSPPAPAVRTGWGRGRRKIPAPCSAPGPARCSAPRWRAAAPEIAWPARRSAACSAA